MKKLTYHYNKVNMCIIKVSAIFLVVGAFLLPSYVSFEKTGDNIFDVLVNGVHVGTMSEADGAEELMQEARKQVALQSSELVFIDADLQVDGREVLWGEVDSDEEVISAMQEVLQDNLNLALGTEGKTFEKWFATEEIGVDALYVADGGVVVLIYGDYVGITADGTVSTEGVNAETGEKEEIGDGSYAAAYSAFVTYTSSTLTEVTLPEGAHQNVLAAYVTESGNYVFELQAAGYGINGEWNKSNEYIKLKIAISSEGKIISTLTTYENESDGIGDVCGTPEYYEQYNGRDAETYKEVPTISGATVTSGGYKKAIERAFAAYELLKGGEVNE